jgi:hypothetical protein
MHFRFFADFKDFNHPTLWEGAVVQGRLYGMNYRADRALEYSQKIVGIGHELMEILRFSCASSLFLLISRF